MDTKKEEICCPPFDLKPWDDKILNWQNKKFITGKIRTFFYIPLNFGKTIINLIKKAEASKAQIESALGLTEHTSKWSMNLLLGVDKKVEGANNIVLNGKFYSKVYEGSYSNIGKWIKDFEQLSTKKNYKIKKLFTSFTTCPKCAKKYGKNYVILIGEIA